MATAADSFTASAERPATPSMPTDPDFLSCVFQPPTSSSSRPDADYTALRRLLLRRKPPSALQHRMEWRCNGKGYVAYRNFLLRRIDGGSAHSTPSNSGRWAPSPGPATFSDADSWSSLRDLRCNSGSLSRTISISSKQSDPERHVRFAEPAYSFVGMHCIFDNCKASVTILKFGRASSDLLAYGAADGSLTVCQVSEPPSVLQKLIGHSKDITDFDFSSNNQYIASCSLDKTVRVWEISKGTCIRVVYGVSSQFCICFHPVNNNLLLVGNANGEINAINFSTGRVISKLTFDDAVTALDIDHSGQLIFAGDAKGFIYTVSVNSHTGLLSRTHKNKSSKTKSRITNIQYRTFSLVARCPVLLSCAQDGNLSFFSIATDAKGYLTLICSLKLASRVQSIRASFCPLLSLEKGEFIVTGSEDANVYFYDLARPKNSCVNKLQESSPRPQQRAAPASALLPRIRRRPPPLCFAMMDLDPRLYENVSVSDNDVRNIVLSYLMHNCFKETAETFLSSTGLQLPVDYSMDMDKRKAILNFVLEGNALKAIELTEEQAPKLLENDTDLHFDLLSLHFTELVRARKCTEALEFGQKRLTLFGKVPKYVEKLEDFMALLAYEEPEKSPMFHLLSPEYRQNVADGLNRAVLAHANLPPYSSLERVVQQATVVRQYLQQEVGKDSYPPFSLKAFLGK